MMLRTRLITTQRNACDFEGSCMSHARESNDQGGWQRQQEDTCEAGLSHGWALQSHGWALQWDSGVEQPVRASCSSLQFLPSCTCRSWAPCGEGLSGPQFGAGTRAGAGCDPGPSCQNPSISLPARRAGRGSLSSAHNRQSHLLLPLELHQRRMQAFCRHTVQQQPISGLERR